MSERIQVAYTGIGYGRPGCAETLRDWGGNSVEPVDVFSLPGVSKAKITVYKTGYSVLSQFPPEIYRLVRKGVENGGGNGIVPSEVVKDKFRADVVIAVSAVASSVLSAGKVPHWVVNVDHHFREKDITRYVTKLFVPGLQTIKDKNIPPHCEVIDAGGVLWPKAYQNIDFLDRSRHLTEKGVPTIGFVTHGAGELVSVQSLLQIIPLLRQQRIHAAFFVGNHHWMSTMLKAIAQRQKIELVTSLDDPKRPGRISIWEGNTIPEILAIKTDLLTGLNYHLSILPTPNENCDTGPALTGEARSAIEEDTFQTGYQGGWINHRGPLKGLLQIIIQLLDTTDGLSRAQIMTNHAREHLVFDAGDKIISEVRKGDFALAHRT